MSSVPPFSSSFPSVGLSSVQETSDGFETAATQQNPPKSSPVIDFEKSTFDPVTPQRGIEEQVVVTATQAAFANGTARFLSHGETRELFDIMAASPSSVRSFPAGTDPFGEEITAHLIGRHIYATIGTTAFMAFEIPRPAPTPVPTPAV